MATSNDKKYDRLEKIHIRRVNWPDLKFPPINLWVMNTFDGYYKSKEKESRVSSR
jgi:hypothetical protein